MSGFGSIIPMVPLYLQPMAVFVLGWTLKELQWQGMTTSAVAKALRTGELCRMRLQMDREGIPQTYYYRDCEFRISA